MDRNQLVTTLMFEAVRLRTPFHRRKHLMKRRSKGASPNGGFLNFWPVEFLEQSLLFFSGAKD